MKSNFRLQIATALIASLLGMTSGCVSNPLPVDTNDPIVRADANAALASSATPIIKQITPPQKILFFGNSFTYYNDSLHNHLSRLVKSGLPAGAKAPKMRTMTISGGRLPEHAASFESMVDSDDWDAVVMQGHSRGPISEDTSHAFQAAANLYSSYLRRKNIQPVFFMTWAYAGRPEMTLPLANAYTQIANYNEAIVAPVGLAFAHATENHPDIALRTEDKKHPNVAGTYLAACVFYATLFRHSPVGLSYTAGLDAATADALQRAALLSTENYFNP